MNPTNSAQCQVFVVEDPAVPIVHIKFEGEGEDFKFFANKHEKEVEVHCERIERKSYNQKDTV